MKNTAQNRAWVELQFRESHDLLLRALTHDARPTLSTLAHLLIDHIENKNVKIRYLNRGVSGAGVLLLIPKEGIAKVVKFGSRSKVVSEYRQFKKNIEGFLPSHIAAFAASDKLTTLSTGWASFCYWWAGGDENVRQINELLLDSVVPSSALIDPLEELMAIVFRWSKPHFSKTANTPAAMMAWHKGSKERIQRLLQQSTHSDARALLRFLDGDCEWLSKIGIKKFSLSARCHGDINYRNVVFSGNIPSRLRLSLIDFGSVKRNISPAYDWSKLERDIHFKCVSELWRKPNITRDVLAAINTCMVSCSLSAIEALPASVNRSSVRTIIALISSIRDKYIRLATPFSDLPLTEYLWFLLYRWLLLLDTGRYPNHDETTRATIITSAASIYEALQQSLVDNSLSDLPAKIVKAIAELNAPATAIDSELNLDRSRFDQSCMRMAVKAAYESKSEDERPHPRVGVVVVTHDGKVRTSYRGETGAGDHAEFGILEKTLRDESLANATVFTTLEPCTDRKHEGLTCVQHLVERRVGRVVIGILNPKAAGKGMHLLQQAGIEVATFPRPFLDELHDLNRHFHRSQNLAQAATRPRDGAEVQKSAQSLDFMGAWYGGWRRPDGNSGRELIHVLTQQGNTIAGTFFNVASPEVPFVFEGIYRPPYLRVQFHSPYKDSQGKGIMEDGSCFLKLQDDGSFTGFYASFDDYGEYEFRRA